MTCPKLRIAGLTALTALVAVLAGCGTPAGQAPAADAGGTYRLEELAVVEGFDVPECVLVDPVADKVYVSNMQTTGEQFWSDDGNAFISRLDPRGLIDKRKWIVSDRDTPLSEPKGMCLTGRLLHVADNTRVRTYTLPSMVCEKIAIDGAMRINDMAAHDGVAYASDTAAGRIYKLGDEITVLKAPESVNGVTFDKFGRMFAVSWDNHEVYELDPAGEKDPEPFGLAEHFTKLDAIEILDDGTFIVSDFHGHKVCEISPDRKTVTTLVEVSSPADIGLDRQRMLLYVPSFEQNKVHVYQIKRRP